MIEPRKADTSVLARKLEYESRTLPEILQMQSHLGDKVMLRSNGKEVSYGEAPSIAARYASRLAKELVGPGDRVLVFMHSRIEQIELWFGLAWLGAIMVPVNTALRGEQLRHAIDTAEPLLIVTETALLEYLCDVKQSVLRVKKLFVVDNAPLSVEGVEMGAECFGPGEIKTKPYAVKPQDTAAILYTSGTTGPSKGVLCPHAQFYWWGVLTGEALGLTPDDVLYTALPLFHTNALNTLWQSLVFGATYSFDASFSASRYWHHAERNGATVTYLLGAMAQILLKQPPQTRDAEISVRTALCPATPLEVVEEFQERFGIKLIEGYGSTETNFVFSNVNGVYAPASMGRVVDGFEVRLVDENDCDVEEGLPGELIVRHREPFSMATGYFGNHEATVKAWSNLWFHTGDRVVCNSDGIYYFVDRIVDAIRRRGENISSWEVENAISSHPAVQAAVVVGVPSDLGSEQDVMAFVVKRKHALVDGVELISFLKSRIAYFAIPRYWEFVAQLPMTPNGKVKKNILRDQGVTGTTWDSVKAGVQVKRDGRT